jgi:hypothetical protein
MTRYPISTLKYMHPDQQSIRITTLPLLDLGTPGTVRKLGPTKEALQCLFSTNNISVYFVLCTLSYNGNTSLTWLRNNNLFYSNLFYPNLFYYNIFYYNLFYYNVLYSNLFYNNLFHSNLFNSILFYSNRFYYNLLNSTKLCHNSILWSGSSKK